MSAFTDVLGAIIPGLSGAERVAGVLAAIGEAVTDGKMWRSLGWLALGLALMGIGLMLWLHKPIENAIGTIGGAALKAP